MSHPLSHNGSIKEPGEFGLNDRQIENIPYSVCVDMWYHSSTLSFRNGIHSMSLKFPIRDTQITKLVD